MPASSHHESLGNVVFLEPGELWKKGATKSLVAAVWPPKEFEASSTFTPELVASIRQHQEEGLKAASLLSSFPELAISHESSWAALRLRASNAEKAAKETEKTLKEKEQALKDKAKELEEATTECDELKTSVQGFETKIKDLEDKVGVSDLSLELALKEKLDLEAEMKVKEEQLKEAKAKFAEVKRMLRQSVMRTFENAIEQDGVLNPGLVTEGMNYLNIVKEGKIVPYTPP